MPNTHEKPRCKLAGTDGNIFALTGRAKQALCRAGLETQAYEMLCKVQAAKSYDEALQVLCEYVDAY